MNDLRTRYHLGKLCLKQFRFFENDNKCDHIVIETNSIPSQHGRLIAKNEETRRLNSFIAAKPSFSPLGLIFSDAVAFFQGPKLKFWQIDLKKSFQMSTNLTCFAFSSLEIFSFKVACFLFSKKSDFENSAVQKELKHTPYKRYLKRSVF